MLKAIIFDFDGTILDTETVWYEVFCEIYAQHGASISLQEYASIVGTQFDASAHLESLTNKPVDREWLDRKLDEEHARRMENAELRPGVLSLLQEAKAKGIRLAIASSSSRPWVIGHLEKYGLLEYFETIWTRDEAEHVKPHPELYLKAMDALQVELCEAFAIEDSPNGTKAAVAAGIPTLIVPNELTQGYLFERYDVRVESLEEVTVEWLEQKLGEVCGERALGYRLNSLGVFEMATKKSIFTSTYFTLEQVTDGVYAAVVKPGTGAVGNAGIIDLGDATLIFDTFYVPQAAEELQDAARQVTNSKVAYVVNSHFHGDHVYGNQVFAEASLFSTTRTREILAGFDWSDKSRVKAAVEEQIEALQEQMVNQTDAGVVEALLLEIADKKVFVEAVPTITRTLPTVTFDEKLVIHGSRRSVELLSWGGGHTQSDAFLYLPKEKILFAGDLVPVQAHPAVGHGDVEQWLQILEQISELEIEILIPGHGEVGNKSSLLETSQYLRDLQQVVDELVANNGSIADLLSAGVPEAYKEWKMPYIYEWNLWALYEKAKKEAA